jgi:hypothetical protein
LISSPRVRHFVLWIPDPDFPEPRVGQLHHFQCEIISVPRILVES